VINYLRTRDNGRAAVGIIYFDYKRQKEQTIRVVLASLLRQIFETQLEAFVVIEDFYTRWSARKIPPSAVDVQEALRTSISKCHEAYIVLDALDEYLANFSHEAIEHLLALLLSLGNNVKLMVTSRVLGAMEGIFRKLEAIRHEIFARNEDMETYVEDRIAKELPFAADLSGLIVEKVMQAAGSRYV
jgi:hypothetical protein